MHENPWKSTKFHEIQRKSVKIDKNPGNSTKIRENLWKSVMIHDNLRKSGKNIENQWFWRSSTQRVKCCTFSYGIGHFQPNHEGEYFPSPRRLLQTYWCTHPWRKSMKIRGNPWNYMQISRTTWKYNNNLMCLIIVLLFLRFKRNRVWPH